MAFDPSPQNELGGGETPLAFRAMEHMPHLKTSIGWQQYRASNTLMRGGINDYRRIGPGKLGGFTADNVLQAPSKRAFYGSGASRAAKAERAANGSRAAQAARAAAEEAETATKAGGVLGRATAKAKGVVSGSHEGMMPWAKGARAEHWTVNPQSLTRNRTLAGFEAAENPRFYSPFHFSRNMIGGQAVKSKAFREAIYGEGATIESIGKENVFQRGMLSMMTTGRRLDKLEAKGSARALRKVGKAQRQIENLAKMNNPTIEGKALEFGRVVKRSEMAANGGKIISMNAPDKAFGTFMSEAGNEIGVSGNLMASAGATAGSRFAQGYVRGALGHAGSGGLTAEAEKGAAKAVQHMNTALGKIGLEGPGLGERALAEGVFDKLGTTGVIKALGTKEGASVLGTRAAAMAMPGLNLLATASLVYDLGKMGGEVIKSGVNLAKDAVKSMKGSIDKPMFGMGYKDNEVAATSRARGVAAIQNSRLNARSALGSEGAMMAAHFG